MVYPGLSAVDFGHIAAEEEAAALQQYFVETKEFSDVMSDKVKLLVVGRKGSGKSAIYVALRDVDFQERATREKPPDQSQRVRLRQILDARFSEEELRDLCFDLGIDYDGLPGESKSIKARELVPYLDRRGRTKELVEAIARQRPDIPVDGLLEEESVSPERQTISPRLSMEFLIVLSDILAKHFGQEELRSISFQLAIDYDSLRGEGTEGKARELVLYANRRALVPELVAAIRSRRPDITALDELLDRISEKETLVPPSSPKRPSVLVYPDRDTVVEALTLQEYPWEVHKRVGDAGSPAELAYVSSWKYVLWVLLAKKALSFDEPARYRLVDPVFWRMIFNANCRYLRRFLRRNYGTVAPSFAELIADRAGRVREIEVKGFQVKADADVDPTQRLVHSINFLNRALQDHILVILPHKKRYYLLFDQLDLGWDNTEETKQLLIGLILAARDVVRAAGKAGRRIRVVLFLRSDIYESLRFEDKNKLSPSIVELRWDKRRLQQLVSRRIEASAGGTWGDVFTEKPMEGKSQLDYIVERTMLRPRDMIQFCICARDAALRLGQGVIDNESIREACPPYSDYMRKEIQDECKAAGVDVDDLLMVLQEIGRERFDQWQFEGACRTQGVSDSKAALQQLIDLSVVGLCRGGSGVVFRYQANPWDQLDPTEELVVHPSLRYALGLVRPESESERSDRLSAEGRDCV